MAPLATWLDDDGLHTHLKRKFTPEVLLILGRGAGGET